MIINSSATEKYAYEHTKHNYQFNDWKKKKKRRLKNQKYSLNLRAISSEKIPDYYSFNRRWAFSLFLVFSPHQMNKVGSLPFIFFMFFLCNKISILLTKSRKKPSDQKFKSTISFFCFQWLSNYEHQNWY